MAIFNSYVSLPEGNQPCLGFMINIIPVIASPSGTVFLVGFTYHMAMIYQWPIDDLPIFEMLVFHTLNQKGGLTLPWFFIRRILLDFNHYTLGIYRIFMGIFELTISRKLDETCIITGWCFQTFFFIFPYMGCHPSQLTNSIIFQVGLKPATSYYLTGA